MTLIEAASSIQQFQGQSLTSTLTMLEAHLQGANRATILSSASALGAGAGTFDAALVLKQAAGQINVVVHAVGILLSLPYILQDGETVQSLSLGAGNTGRSFDLETNVRVAEFKFTHWRGGAEAIRQNQLFKDFYLLAEYKGPKQRYLYVVGSSQPLRFFNNRRALSSVLSHNNKLWTEFQQQYGERFTKVNEYYNYRKPFVHLVDLAHLVPYFADSTSGLTTVNGDGDGDEDA